jgi:hypothetical protein
VILFHVPRLYSMKIDMKVVRMDRKVVMTSLKLLSHYLCEVYEENHQQSQDNFQPNKNFDCLPLNFRL